MEWNEIIMTAAVVIGPIVAVQIQIWLDRGRIKKERKYAIFKTLMTTRSTRVSIEHVQSLNMIDIEFKDRGFEKVVTAWRNYHDHLSNGDNKSTSWSDKSQDLFVELLYVMGESLGYKFDKVMLRRTGYSPIAHGDIEYEQQSIRRGLASILSGNDSLPVYFTNTATSSNEVSEE